MTEKTKATVQELNAIVDKVYQLRDAYPDRYKVELLEFPDDDNHLIRVKYKPTPTSFEEEWEYMSNPNPYLAEHFENNEYFMTNLRIHYMVKKPSTKTTTDWDHRMLKMAAGEINTWSKDPSTKVSATIFRDKHPVASSYNGFPPGIEDTEERLNNRELKYKLVQHAEANAISVCAKLGISTQGTTMAVTHFPCSTCAGMMITAGIKKVIVQSPDEDFLSRWKDSVDLSKEMFKEAGVELVVIDIKENA